MRVRPLYSSFYGKFEEDDYEDDDDEEEEDDNEYGDLDDKAVADFRTRMSSLFGNQDDDGDDDDASIADELLQLSVDDKPEEWARAVETASEGCILVANPAAFCTDFDDVAGSRGGSQQRGTGRRNKNPNPQLLSMFGLTLPPPADLGADRRADLLPVLVITDYDARMGGSARAVLLNRRTGYLLGDLEQRPPDGSQQQQQPANPVLEKFCIQPLWFGGVDNDAGSTGGGLDMLHLCPAVVGAKQITDDGLYWGGDPAQAQEAMSDPSLDRVMTGFDFRFFVQSTSFGPGELQRELDNGTFFCAAVAKEILFKSRDRMGTRRAKPLWTEIMELMGGEYRTVRDRLYGLDGDDDDKGDEGLLQ